MQQSLMVSGRAAPQVFDSGLIGEGVLHAVAAAAAKVAAKDAILVPAAATVYAQPLQLQRASAVVLPAAPTRCCRAHTRGCAREAWDSSDDRDRGCGDTGGSGGGSGPPGDGSAGSAECACRAGGGAVRLDVSSTNK